ncbi:MAG: hypothetical protein HN554_06720 [Euryarchaeota archaeon]|jgi:hypothetical protein|nr:hypothetical protein [Euryarchaeota archaeon]
MSKGNYRMSEPELRSVGMLQSVVKENSNVEIVILTHEYIKVRVQGESNRWYQIESRYQGEDIDIFISQQPEWSLSVTAARWQNDVISENNYSVDLCLHPKNQQLPIGDRIVSLVLALYNDIKTALEIPMLAQFIVCKREMLKEIVIFQDTMIVTQEMVMEDHWPFEEDMDEQEETDDEEEMEMYEAFERDIFGVSSNEMAALHKSWEDEIIEISESQKREIEDDFERQEREKQEVIDFWEGMSDKLLDK